MSTFFGRYELLRKIATGGMGQVLLARKGAEGFQKLVVIKRILPHLVEDEEFFTMFIDEAKITMRLDHPNIARINEFGVENGVHFIEMEYVFGEDVRRLDTRSRLAKKPLALGVIIRIIADAAAGLDFAHKAKDSKGLPLHLVHRDVSPQNILVGFDGAVKLIDFGVAKAAGRSVHTATGIVKGKFPYMSPEQVDGRDLDGRSDVFALGVILWELLTGKRLFKGENDLMTQRLVKACQVPPPSQVEPSLPPALDAVVLKSLARNVKDRYVDAGAFQSALEDFAFSNAVPASHSVLVDFMHVLYAERIAKEADARSFEEDSGLTDLDVGGLQQNAQSPTILDRARQTMNHTQPVARPPKSRSSLWLGVGLLGAVLIGSMLSSFADCGPKPPRAETPSVMRLPQTQVEPPTVVEFLTFVVISEPIGAEVELGGNRRGLTPLEVTLEKAQLPTLVKVSLDGYEPFQTTLAESTGPRLSVTLKKRFAVKSGLKPSDIKTTR
jgi:serine/threonine protein kinase